MRFVSAQPIRGCAGTPVKSKRDGVPFEGEEDTPAAPNPETDSKKRGPFLATSED
jgi:hypothetical protein